jgi:predicted glycosyltransferase
MDQDENLPDRAKPPASQLRIALYSHDTQGLGHIRRNLAIANALQTSPTPTAMLLISGTQVGGAFDLPAGVDLLTLPAIGKNGRGEYSARTLPMTLEEVSSLRMRIIASALESFAPNVLIVDKVPSGLLGELIPALNLLRQQGQTRCVLGLRDVLDDPATTRREWAHADNTALINAYYDAVWIYGDPRVYDPLREYGLDQLLPGRVHYTGYLDRWQGLTMPAQGLKPARRKAKRLALCMVGGGQDGGDLAHAFASADLPPGVRGVLVTGPYMSPAVRRQIQRVARHQPRLQVVEFVADPAPLLRQADFVISMGGYNSICEILAQQKRALIVPRVQPRREQWIRAQRLAALGLVDVLHPDKLKPKKLTRWLSQAKEQKHHPRIPVDLAGCARLPQLLQSLLEF